MPAILSPEIRELRSRMRVFIDDEVIPLESVLDRGDAQADLALDALRARAKERGLWALGHPEEIGGGGLSFLEYLLVNEIIGRSEHGMVATGSNTLQDSLLLHEHATLDQRERWLLPLVEAGYGACTAMTEPEVAGSDPTLIQGRAVLDGDEWVLSAHKWFTTWADRARFAICYVVTDPDAERHERFSAFIVPTNMPGFTIVRDLEVMGYRGGHHCEVRFDDVRLPRSALLGGRGDGFRLGSDRTIRGRLFHCMRWLGQAQRAFELMCERATARYAHGSLLSEKGEIQRYVAESVAQIQSVRLLTFDAARVLDEGGDPRTVVSLLKFVGAQMLHDVIDRAIQVHGALGVTGDTPLSRMYREARLARIYDGPDEVHRMTVARWVLRDPVTNAPWFED